MQTADQYAPHFRTGRAAMTGSRGMSRIFPARGFTRSVKVIRRIVDAEIPKGGGAGSSYDLPAYVDSSLLNFERFFFSRELAIRAAFCTQKAYLQTLASIKPKTTTCKCVP